MPKNPCGRSKCDWLKLSVGGENEKMKIATKIRLNEDATIRNLEEGIVTSYFYDDCEKERDVRTLVRISVIVNKTSQ